MEHQDHWKDLSRRILRMGPPQVPGPAIVNQVKGICDGAPGLTVLLGVTPAYAGLGDRLIGFDTSPGMIRAIWPGNDARRQAQLASWTDLPLADHSASQVVGDGSLNAVPDRDAVIAVLTEVRRILHPGRPAAIRVFVRPDPEETADQVLALARAGRLPSLNVLRWRLAAALATGPDHTVVVENILQAALSLGDLAEFARQHNMPPDEADHLLAYAGSPVRYVFPDRDAFMADAAQAGFTGHWAETEGYPGAELCPIAVLRAAP